MRKRYALLAVPFLLLSLLPRHSVYNGTTGALYCDSSGGCLHEIGHKMDGDLGYPSRSAEFGNAIMIHLAFTLQYGTDDCTTAVLAQPGLITYSPLYTPLGLERFSSPQEELYANLYQTSGGNVDALPMALREFYSLDTQYTDLYNCLMSADFKVCGLAIHKER